MSDFKKWWEKLKPKQQRSPTIYYIAGDGNDMHDGKHPLQAWKSIAQLNSAKNQIRVSDQILFKRGHSYPGRPFYLGRSNFPIQIGAYGSGQYPVFPDVEPNKKLKNI
ncbi:MAG: hypothetical protein HKN76_22435 [Saprospiraceae bacterium]|nr:hypothetical protein [Saprospiraceae bacterium]